MNEKSTPSLNNLWGVFESSTSCVKLILPDLVFTPHYLPKAKIRKSSTKEETEREMKRFDFLCNRDNTKIVKSSFSNAMSLIPKMLLKGKELEIENRLLDPYRYDATKKKELIREANLKSKNQALIKKKIEPKPPTISPLKSVVERQTIVAHRRTTILVNHEQAIQDLAQRLHEKQLQVQQKIEENSPSVLYERTTDWLKITQTLNCFLKMYSIVVDIRKTKALNPVRWKACMKIQKLVRRRQEYLRQIKSGCVVQNSAAMDKLMLSAKRSKNRALFLQRQHACTVVLDFLRAAEGKIQVIAQKFIRKIKHLQRLVRIHLSFNQTRINLVRRLFEICIPILMLHIDLILNDRGLDLQNLTSMDVSKLKLYAQTTSKYKILQQIYSANFHSILRNHILQLPNMVLLFGSTTATKSSKEIEDTKKLELFELLIRKRRQFVMNLESTKVVQLHFPAFTAIDVKSYIIQGGTDPLTQYIADVVQEQEAKREAFELRRTIHRNKTMVGGSSGGATSTSGGGNSNMLSIGNTAVTDSGSSNGAVMGNINNSSGNSSNNNYSSYHTPSELCFLFIDSVTAEDLLSWMMNVVAKCSRSNVLQQKLQLSRNAAAVSRRRSTMRTTANNNNNSNTSIATTNTNTDNNTSSRILLNIQNSNNSNSKNALVNKSSNSNSSSNSIRPATPPSRINNNNRMAASPNLNNNRRIVS